MASAISVQLLTIIVMIGLTSAVCPCGFVNVHNACYCLNTNPTTWNSAWKECVKKGGFLAEFVEPLKLDNLIQFLETQDGDQPFWLGASDGIVHGDWRWMKSGRRLFIEQKYWCPGQPLMDESLHYHGLVLDAEKGCLMNANPSLPFLKDTSIGFICEADHVDGL